MVEAWQFRNWQWWALLLSAPVVTWGAWPFHRSAAMNLRHRTATMDTLISIGVISAVTWSVWALVWGDAASMWGSMGSMLGMSHDNEYHVYFEVATTVTVFSRWTELVGEAVAQHVRPLKLDRGVLVVCDTRLSTTGYGRRLMGALPPMARVSSQDVLLEGLTRLTTFSTKAS